MEWLRILLVQILCSGGLCQDGMAGKDEMERRLHALGRHIKILEHEPELLDDRGLTPVIRLRGLHLRHVFTVNRKKPWLIGHAEFSDDYHKRRRLRRLRESSRDNTDSEHLDPGNRRLSEIQTGMLKQVAAIPWSFRTPRDRVRVFTVLNGAVLPDEAYTNASNTFWEAGGQVHGPGQESMVFAQNVSEINDPVITDDHGGWTVEQMGANFSGDAETVGNAWRDGNALRGAKDSIRATAFEAQMSDVPRPQKYDWYEYFYMGLRYFDCALKSETEPRCWSDPGVAVSVYQDKENKVIIFHSDWTIDWKDYIVWQNKDWVIEQVVEQIKSQWIDDARQVNTVDMQKKCGNHVDAYPECLTSDVPPLLLECENDQHSNLEYRNDEKMERCAFKDVAYQGIKDTKTMSAQTDQSTDQLTNYGYWAIMKKVMRKLLPENRDRVLEKARTHYFTGTGFGGTWAALCSMWLQRNDDMLYEAYIIAGVGWQCFARSLIYDMDATAKHSQLKVYAHVMDIYARMGRISGTQCLYGFTNMTGDSDVYKYCSGIVGFTGPQLFYRGKPRPHQTNPSGEYLNPHIRENVLQARKDFDSCHYFTHSPWYAAMLFLDDRVLMHDGTTDGGCKEVDAVPAIDRLGMCPYAGDVHDYCLPVPDNSQALPYVEMTAVVIGLLSFIFCGGVVGYAAILHFRNDMWIFGYDKKAAHKHKMSFYDFVLTQLGLGKELKKRKKMVIGIDRAKKARNRKKQLRMEKTARNLEGGGKKKKKKNEVTLDSHSGFQLMHTAHNMKVIAQALVKKNKHKEQRVLTAEMRTHGGDELVTYAEMCHDLEDQNFDETKLQEIWESLEKAEAHKADSDDEEEAFLPAASAIGADDAHEGVEAPRSPEEEMEEGSGSTPVAALSEPAPKGRRRSVKSTESKTGSRLKPPKKKRDDDEKSNASQTSHSPRPSPRGSAGSRSPRPEEAGLAAASSEPAPKGRRRSVKSTESKTGSRLKPPTKKRDDDEKSNASQTLHSPRPSPRGSEGLKKPPSSHSPRPSPRASGDPKTPARSSHSPRPSPRSSAPSAASKSPRPSVRSAASKSPRPSDADDHF